MTYMYEATILGVDPGELVGLFHVHVYIVDLYVGTGAASENPIADIEVRSNIHAAELDRDRAHAFIDLKLQNHGPATLVAMERYLVTQRTARLTQQPAALEFIGATRQLCKAHGVNMTMQMKSDASHLGNDATLKRIGWWQSHKHGHANDAARHALLALSGFHARVFHALMTRGSIATSM